jgi:hypothetical protein
MGGKAAAAAVLLLALAGPAAAQVAPEPASVNPYGPTFGLPEPSVPGVARVSGLGGLCDPCNPCDPCAPGACPAPAPCPPDACPPPPKVPWRLRWNPCEQPPPYWVSAEYLLWHVSNGPQGMNLGGTSPATSLAQLLANPTAVSAPDRASGLPMSSGIRVSAGRWFGPYDRLGAEVSGFVLERRSEGTTLASNAAGSPTIIRPFTNATTGLPDFAVVALPGSAVGSLTTHSNSRVAGAETNFLVRAVVQPDHYVTPLVGIRYLDLDDDLDVIQQTTLTGRGVGGFAGRTITAPQGLVVADRFDTRTQFLGGQFGAKFGTRYNRLDVGAYWKVALGWSHHAAETSGTTTLTGPGGGAVVPGGLLVTNSNAGRNNADDFAVVPELGLNLGYDVAPWLRLTAGYSALYWSRVLRPGDLVQTTVNPGQVPSSLQFGRPGTAVPQPTLVREGLWINGVQFGAVVRF